MAVVLATASYDNSIRFWDASSARCTSFINTGQKHVHALAISPDKTTILAAGNPTIRMYDIPTATHAAKDDPVSGGSLMARGASSHSRRRS
jgi:WD40 repeat protein